MRVPFGLAPVTMGVCAAAAGIYLAATSPAREKKPDIVFWVFAKAHYDAYLKALPKFQAAHPGVKIHIENVSNNGLAQRLRAAFQAGVDVPDMCEIEISQAGSFFRGPVERVGFLNIKPFLERDHILERVIASRLAPYTNRGQIFGMPHDVHPVMIAYNRELFSQNGIDPSSLTTWEKFIEVGQRLTKPGERYMTEFSSTGTGQIEMLLFQRDGGYFSPDGAVIFDNQTAIDTVKWYVPLVAQGSKRRIGNEVAWGAATKEALESGYLTTIITPDWRSKLHETDVGKLKGKMGLMPLPMVQEGGRPTSTWGGTMLGITKKSKNPELAWELAKFLYLSEKDLAERFADTYILPPVPSAWKEPAFDQAFDYYAGQKIGRDYAKLAPQVPPQYSSPYVDVAKGKFGEALINCVKFYEKNGENGFDAYTAKTLKEKADEVRLQMSRNPF